MPNGAFFHIFFLKELQDILKNWNYNFSEASCFLEREGKAKEAQLKQDKMKKLKQQVKKHKYSFQFEPFSFFYMFTN